MTGQMLVRLLNWFPLTFKYRGLSEEGDTGVNQLGFLFTNGPYSGDGLPFVALSNPVSKVAAGGCFFSILVSLFFSYNRYTKRSLFYLRSRGGRTRSGWIELLDFQLQADEIAVLWEWRRQLSWR